MFKSFFHVQQTVSLSKLIYVVYFSGSNRDSSLNTIRTVPDAFLLQTGNQKRFKQKIENNLFLLSQNTDLPTAPATCGADILVPFIRQDLLIRNSGTDVMAAPGAITVTPRPPSMHGSRDVHVYTLAGSFSRIEYSDSII